MFLTATLSITPTGFNQSPLISAATGSKADKSLDAFANKWYPEFTSELTINSVQTASW